MAGPGRQQVAAPAPRAALAAVCLFLGIVCITRGEERKSSPPSSAGLAALSPAEAAQAHNARCLSLKLALAELPPAQLAQLARTGYSAVEAVSPLLEPADVVYLGRMRLLRDIAAAQRGAPDLTPQQTAERLLRFVAREMSPAAGAGDDYDLPEQMLARGRGSCDQQCWVLASLLRQSGFDCVLVFLRRPGAAVSHHTILLARYNPNRQPLATPQEPPGADATPAPNSSGAADLYKWLGLDPFAGLLLRDREGKPTDMLHALAHPETLTPYPTEGSTAPLFAAEQLAVSQFLVYTEPRGILPRWSVYETTSGENSYRIRFYDNIVALAESFQAELKTSLQQKNGQNKLSTDKIEAASTGLYGEPERIEQNLCNALKYKEIISKRLPPALFSARLKHLSGSPEKCLEMLSESIPQTATADSTAKVEIAYFSALSLQQLGKYRDAETILTEWSETAGPYQVGAIWNLFLCKIAQKSLSQAADLVTKMPESRRSEAVFELNQ